VFSLLKESSLPDKVETRQREVLAALAAAKVTGIADLLVVAVVKVARVAQVEAAATSVAGAGLWRSSVSLAARRLTKSGLAGVALGSHRVVAPVLPVLLE